MQTIYRSEGSASLRRVPMWLMLSNGTAPATGEAGGQPQINYLPRGTATANTAATLSLISANAGLYYVELSASEVSALGILSVQYRSATAIAQTSFAQVVNYDSGDSTRFGLVSLPNAAAEAAGGLITIGTGTGQLHVSSGSVGLKAQAHSGASVEIKTGGIQTASVGVGNYSGVSVGVLDIKPAAYSGVSVEVTTGGIQVASVGKGSYSGVSVEIKAGGIQTSSVGAGAYSGVSVEITTGGLQVASVGKGNYSGVSVGVLDIKPASYSGVSVEVKTGGIQTSSVGVGNYSGVSVEILAGGIQASSFGASAVDAAALATSAGQEIADRVLMRSIMGGDDSGRSVGQAMAVLRNRVFMSGSTGTVYLNDDTNSMWTFSISTVPAVAITELDPGGA